MTTETRFSSELEHIKHLPEPFADVMAQQIRPHEIVSLLIFKPMETAGTETSPPKALAVTDSGLIFAELVEGRPIRAVRCTFETVLLVELATLLLYGHLRIDYVEGGNRRVIAMEYNSVSHDLYRRAAQLVLGSASPQRQSARKYKSLDLATWPTIARVGAEFAMLSDAPLYDGAWWPSVRSGFGSELAPMGAVLARENRLTVITLEQSGPWDRVRAEPTFGVIATYLPAGRINQVKSLQTPKLTIFDLEMHARHGGEIFQLAVPVDRETVVRSVIDTVLSQA